MAPRPETRRARRAWRRSAYSARRIS
jgi:hypothetical protein